MRDGSHEVGDGSHEVRDGSHEVRDGSHEVEDRSQEVEDGSHEVRDGSHEVRDGSHEVRDGSHEVEDRSQEVEDGSHEVRDGSHEVRDGSHEMEDAQHNTSPTTLTKTLAASNENYLHVHILYNMQHTHTTTWYSTQYAAHTCILVLITSIGVLPKTLAAPATPPHSMVLRAPMSLELSPPWNHFLR